MTLADQNRLDPTALILSTPPRRSATVTVAPASATWSSEPPTFGSSTPRSEPRTAGQRAERRSRHNEPRRSRPCSEQHHRRMVEHSSPGMPRSLHARGSSKASHEGSAAITATAGGRSADDLLSDQRAPEDPFPPAQPSNVVAVPASDTEMDVTPWTDNSNPTRTSSGLSRNRGLNTSLSTTMRRHLGCVPWSE